MPSYLSHAIMADKLHFKLRDIGIITNRPNLRLSSLIPDLASKKTNNHNVKTEEYIIYLITYIKDNNLTNDIETKTLLYGIISHYFLDTTTHPFIYSLDFNNHEPSLIRPHHYIEGYLNYYLANKVMEKNILQISPSFCTKGTITDSNKKLLDETYKKFYGTKIMPIINYNLKLIKLLEFAYKKVVKNNYLVAQLTGYITYLKNNQLTSEILDNRAHNIWTNPFTKEKSNKSFIELYNKATTSCLDTIEDIELYFDNIISIEELYNIFNKSYDTGTTLKLKK